MIEYKTLRGWATALFLALACALLYRNAIHTGWAYDDPAHLSFATVYSPWQYFTVPEVMRLQSHAHVTPWNVLFYAIGLALGAGVDPRWHHVHLVVVVWATAMATWVLLKRWLSEGRALLGALLFLTMPATIGLVTALTIGHYAYGLLFTVLAFIFFSRAMEKKSFLVACVAALMYAMASLSKELYVPLPLLLLLWPEGRWRARLRLAVPSLIVAAGYAVLRWRAVGGLGGMHGETWGGALQLLQPAVGRSFLQGAYELSFGTGALGLGAIVLTGVALFLPGRRPRKLAPLFVLACFGVLLAPIAPLVRENPDTESLRFVCFMAWGLAVLIAWRLPVRRVVGVTIAVLLGGLLTGTQHRAAQSFAAHTEALASEYAFMADAPPGAVLLPVNFQRLGYLQMMSRVVQRTTGRTPVVVLSNEDELVALGAARGRLVWAWQEACHCLQPLGDQYAQRTQGYVQRLAAGQHQVLGIDLSVEDHGRLKTLRWKLTGMAGQAWVDIASAGRLPMPAEGDYSFSTDNTSEMSDPLRVRFTAEAADGSLIRTPVLTLPLSRSYKLAWPPDVTAP